MRFFREFNGKTPASPERKRRGGARDPAVALPPGFRPGLLVGERTPRGRLNAVTRTVLTVVVVSTLRADAAEPLMFAGPAMGTTYRATLARDVPGMTRGELHREIEDVLAGVDRALSTWRTDSDASRFNRAAAGEWVNVASDLVAVVTIARQVYDDTGGAFDITTAPGTVAGMHLVEIREQPPALRKARDGVALDLGGVGPGYAVDAIGERLVALGSKNHLVELGGEVRAWGEPPSGGRWRVAIRGTHDVWELAPGEAVATSTVRPGRSPVDPRTGRVVTPQLPSATVRAATCAEADARAVAELVGGPEKP